MWLEVTLTISRMCAEWDRQGSGRKSYGSKELIPLHMACGGFLAFMRALKEKIPSAEFEKHDASLRQQFMTGALDPEILHALRVSVPPASLEAVNFLRRGS